jgi:hypothetical protein
LYLAIKPKRKTTEKKGRDLIRKTLHDKGVLFGFYEVAWAQRELNTTLNTTLCPSDFIETK